MTFLLEGRCAVVTGAASGLGEAIALGYAAAGARVWLIDRDRDGLQRVIESCRNLGAAAHYCVADLGDSEGPGNAIDAALRAMGRVDILVNSAGIADQGIVAELSVERWDRMMAIDLRSVFLCCRHVLPGMCTQRWGRIINVASQLGIKGAPELAHYAAAKAGVIGFTKSLALEAAQYNVLANCIAPGPIDTQMIAGISDEWKAAKAQQLPLGRFGQVDEVVPTALLLASEPGGNLYLGQTLGPNSGDVMP